MNASFEQFHASNLAVASGLRQRSIFVGGVGAVGSNVAALLALMGASVIVCDPDPLHVQNLPRTRGDQAYMTVPKGLAVAATIRGLVPEGQRVTGLPHDLLKIPQTEVWNLLQDVDAVVAATGSDDADRLLNWFCLHLGIPLLVPSMWPQDNAVLADLLVVPSDQPHRGVGCFECLRPPRDIPTPMLEAQEGLAAEVNLVASVTAMTVIGTLLPDSEEGRDLTRLFQRTAGYRVIRRQPFAVIPVRNPRVPGCRACTAVSESRVGPANDAARRRRFRLPSRVQLRRRVEDFLV